MTDDMYDLEQAPTPEPRLEQAPEQPSGDTSTNNRPSRPRTSGRRRTKSNAGLDRATVQRVLDARHTVEDFDDTMRFVSSRVSESTDDVDALTVAILGDTSWAQPLGRLVELSTEESFDALVELADQDDQARRGLWRILDSVVDGEQARLAPSTGKASKQIADEIAALPHEIVEAADRVLAHVAGN